MKKQIHSPTPLILTPGYFYEQSWDNREDMTHGINNWEFHCTYQLQPKALCGHRQVLHLQSMQVNHVKRVAGMMHSPTSPENSFNILLIEGCENKACLGPMKLQAGDIIFFDDSYTHNFINSGEIEFTVVTIQKSSLGSLLPTLTKVINHHIYDTDARFASTLHKIWKRFADTPVQETKSQNFEKAEDEILSVIIEFLSEQTPAIPTLTDGERTVLKIRDQVFGHMDGNVSIGSLAKQHQISEQTMQVSFKSLFGYTPKRFLRLLKLNLVHQELIKSNAKETTVTKTAFKWGFTHMGQFTAYYTELFGQNPSETLRTPYFHEENIKEGCVARQEEI